MELGPAIKLHFFLILIFKTFRFCQRFRQAPTGKGSGGWALVGEGMVADCPAAHLGNEGLGASQASCSRSLVCQVLLCFSVCLFFFF